MLTARRGPHSNSQEKVNKNSGQKNSNNFCRAGKTAQWEKVLATEPNDLNSTSRTHMVTGENQLP